MKSPSRPSEAATADQLANGWEKCSPFHLSLEELKQQAAALDATSQGELLVFLATLREERWAAEARRLGAKLDDPNPDRWLTPEVFWARVDEIPAPPDN
jgi:hypothetical protein